MRILFLLGIYPSYGGVEKVTTILANEFANRGHTVGIVSFEQPHPEMAKKELDNRVLLFKMDKPVYSSINIKILRDILIGMQTDVLINQWVVPFFVTRLCRHAMKGTGCKLINVHHNMPDTNARIKDVEIALEQNPSKRWLYRIRLLAVRTVSRLSLRYAYEHCDKFIVLAPSFIPVLSRYIMRSKVDKAMSIYNPITIREINSCHDKKRKEIIFVGRIEDNQKRTQRLIDVWKELEPLYPDWRFTIVGDGPDRQRLQTRINNEQLHHVSIVGFSDPEEYYDRASILILVSEYEGFGLVVVEAMSRGTVPVVLGSYTAIYDMVQDGHDALIVPHPFDVSNFVKKMRWLMDDDEKRKKMSVEAVISSGDFERDTIVNEWEYLFSKLKANN